MKLYQEVQERLNVLTPETPRDQVWDTMENLIPLLAGLDEVEFERLWANLAERLNLRGKFHGIAAENSEDQEATRK